MTPDEWQRIKAVACETWNQPAAERAAYAARACGGDETLHTEVRRLLDSMSDAAGLFESPDVALPREPDPSK
jgi:hypothetical protein